MPRMRRLTMISPAVTAVALVVMLQGRTLALPADSHHPAFALGHVETLGESGVPYVRSAAQLNQPSGLFADGDAVWIAGSGGHRLLKFANTGSFEDEIGRAGLTWGFYDGSVRRIEDVALRYVAAPVPTGTPPPTPTPIPPHQHVWIVDSGSHTAVGLVRETGATTVLGEPDVPGADNAHFSYPTGIALDDAGNVYVSDTGNHRVQVFDSDGTFLVTIGTTGRPAADDTGFHSPARLAVGPDRRLYVADTGNHRVQAFDITDVNRPRLVDTYGRSGVPGLADDQFDAPVGIAVGETLVYVADTGNCRVQVLERTDHDLFRTYGGDQGCAMGGELRMPTDVAIDDSGFLYVADRRAMTVLQYRPWDAALAATFGSADRPYVSDATHLNEPAGVAVAADGRIVTAERAGQRVLARAADGSHLWEFGEAGLPGGGDDHLDAPGDVAIDGNGNAWVADTGNDRLVVLGADGGVVRIVGATGTGDGEFDCPTGVAIAADARVLVADACNRRVQILAPDGAHRTTLRGAFSRPVDVAVDGTGQVYVADAERHVVDVFDASLQPVRSIGIEGQFGVSFDRFQTPSRLAVDVEDRLYVADTANNRVQVYAADGEYLTTVANRAGMSFGELREPLGLSVTSAGRVYVADSGNHRVQVFEPARDPWEAASKNGFARRDVAGVTALIVLGDDLLAGDYVPSGATSIRRRDSSTGNWAPLPGQPFDDPNDIAVSSLHAFGDRLYAGGWNRQTTVDSITGVESYSSIGGAIARTSDGSSWERPADRGFGQSANVAVSALHDYDGELFAGTWRHGDDRGADVWRSPTGDSGSWSRTVENGFGDAGNVAVSSMGVFTDTLFIGTCHASGAGQLWRSTNGISWAVAAPNDTGELSRFGPSCISDLIEYDGYLYAALANDERVARPRGAAELWRCQGCDGEDWESVIPAGMGISANRGRAALGVFHDPPFTFLYLALGNREALQVWRTSDGETWEPSSLDGFGDSNNTDVFGEGAFAEHDGRLYAATINDAHGGELWSTSGARPSGIATPTGVPVTPTPRPSPQPPTGRTAYGVVDQWPVPEVVAENVISRVVDVAVADDGTVLIADEALNRITVLGADDMWSTPFGTQGRGPERIGQVGAVAVDSTRDRMYVSDVASERLVVYTREGALVDAWLDVYVTGIDVQADGKLWIADRMAGAVRLLDVDGSELDRFGTYGNRPEDQFRQLRDVTVDTAGTIYVSDLDGDRIRAFRPAPGGGYQRHRLIDLTRNDFTGCTAMRMQALGVERLLVDGCLIQGVDRERVLSARLAGSDLVGVQMHTANVTSGHFVALGVYDTDIRDANNPTYPVLVRFRDERFNLVTTLVPARDLDARTAGAAGAINAPTRLSTAPDGSLMLSDEFGLRQRAPDGRVLEVLPVQQYPNARTTLFVQRPDLLVGEGSGGRVMGVARGRSMIGRDRTFIWMAFQAETEMRRYCTFRRTCTMQPFLKVLRTAPLPSLTEGDQYAITATAHEPVGNQFVVLTRYRTEPRLVASQLVIYRVNSFGRRTTIELAGDETDSLWTDLDAGPTGRVYVLDPLNDSVQVFSSTWDDLGVVAVPKDAWRVAGGPNDEIYVLTVYGHVVRMAADGTVLSRFVARPHEGVAVTSLVDLAVDAYGWVYTVDEQANQVTVFAPTGKEEDVIQGGTCNIEGDKWAAPRDVLLGDDVRVFLQLFGTCGFVEEPADIVLAINSRGQSDGLTGALAENLRAARQIAALTDLDRHRLGVIAYSRNGEAVQALTHETRLIVRALRNAHAGRGQPSNTYPGLVEAAGLFDPPGGRKHVIVLIGPRTNETDDKAVGLAEQLKADGTLIMVVNGESVVATGDVFDDIDVPTRATGGGRAAHRRMVERRWPDVLIKSGTLVDRIPDNMQYVLGSSSPAAVWDATRRTLTWALTDLPLGAGHTFSLDVVPQQEGEWPTNADAKADFVDGWDNAGLVVMPVPRVRVYGELPTPTQVATATYTPSPTPIPSPTPEPKPLYLPVIVRDVCEPKDRNADVVLTIDTSGSMSDSTTPGGPTKLTAAKGAARSFLGNMVSGRDQASIVQFNTEAEVVVSLTDDIASAIAGLDNLTQHSGTRIDLAIDASREVLQGPERRPANTAVVILLTDGLPTETTREDVMAAAARAHDAGVLVFTIGLGSSVDHALLSECASVPQWYFHAPDTSDLQRIYEQIAGEIPCVPAWP